MLAIQSLSAFRAKWPEQLIKVKNLTWRMIDTSSQVTYTKDAPILLLLPGTQGTPEIFWNQIQALNQHIRIISLGYPAIPSAFQLAQSLKNLFNELKINKANLLGSSLGAYIGQLAAIDYPEKIETLFLANGMADARPIVAKRTPSAELIKLSTEQLRSNIFKRIDSFPEPDKGFTDMKQVLKETVSERMSGEELKARFLALDGCGILPKIALPDSRIVIIECEDDFVIDEALRTELRWRHPKAKIHTLISGGHFPYITRPDDYTKIIKEELAHQLSKDNNEVPHPFL